MSILRDLLNDHESVRMTAEEFDELISDALEEIKGESDEDDPICEFSIGRTDPNQYEFGYSYNGFSFDVISIKIVEEDEHGYYF